MDDHKWAYYVWEKYRCKSVHNPPFTLVHLDRHWDGVDDFTNNPSEKEKLIKIDTLKPIYQLLASGSNLIRKDSFIAPAIMRDLVNEIHFYCTQTDTEIGIDEPLLREFEARQFIHVDIKSLIERVSGQRIFFDIDLDLFNKSDMFLEGDLWEENEIVDFIDQCSPILKNSSTITISMSFGYSGTQQDMYYLTKLVVPRLLHYFEI